MYMSKTDMVVFDVLNKIPDNIVIRYFMGREMGFEPTHNGTTIRGLNHLTTPAIDFIIIKTYFLYKFFIKKRLNRSPTFLIKQFF